MPSYNAQPVRAVYPGASITLVDTATDAGLTTSQQFAVGPNPVNTSNVVNFVNTTDHDAQGQISPDDSSTSSYANASGLIVPAGTSLPYNLADGFVRFTFAVAPTSGKLIAVR